MDTPSIFPAKALGCRWLHAQVMPKVSFVVPFYLLSTDEFLIIAIFSDVCSTQIASAEFLLCLCDGAKGPKGCNDTD